jgi:hypothetical protein
MVSDWHPDDRATLAYEQLLAIAQAIAPVTGGVPRLDSDAAPALL